MKQLHTAYSDSELMRTLQIDCENCSGLCCVALYFAKSEGFPTDKPIGKPCENLLPDFRCAIHDALKSRKMKGCMAYDCLGAGQLVTQSCYAGENWRTAPALAVQMFDVFLIVCRLRQMLWYLLEAASLIPAECLRPEIDALILENERMTRLPPAELLALEPEPYRSQVNRILQKTGELVLAAAGRTAGFRRSADFIGKNFKKANLSGTDFSMSLLVAANLEGCNLYGVNFLGADLRDAVIRNTDLSDSVFLTQGQINAAKGNHATKLPAALRAPAAWGS